MFVCSTAREEEADEVTVVCLFLSSKGFSVRTIVKKETFSLKQLVTELRTAGTASDMDKNLIHSLLFLT